MKAIMVTQQAGQKTQRALGKRKLYRRVCEECDYRTEWFETYAELKPYKYCPQGCEEDEGIPLNIDFNKRTITA